MAIDYPRLFADIGSLITEIDRIRDTTVSLNSPRPDLVEAEQNIQDELTTTSAGTPRSRFSSLSGLDETFVTIKNEMVSKCTQLAIYVDDLLLDETTVWGHLPGMGAGVTLDRVLVELFNDMLRNSQSVTRSIATIGTPAIIRNNGTSYDQGDPLSIARGDGSVFITKRLDGETRPGRLLPSQAQYSGRDSELVVQSEDLLWTCTSDQYSGGTPDGGEQFTLESRPRLGGEFMWQTEGSGERQTVNVANSETALLANADFEAWTDPANPDSWDLVAGSVDQATDVYRGDSSLHFPLTGKISQSITGLLPRTMYCVTLAHKAGAANADLTMKFEGTLANGNPYVATGEELLNVQIGTDWTQSAIFYLVPDQPMVDAALTIQAGAEMWIDSMSLTPVTYVGGVGTVITAGTSPWVLLDRVQANISNNDAGRFQRFWRKHYGRQLPSSSSPTITEPDV